MLKREIKYLDYNDEEVTDTYYFNLTKSEIIEMESGREGGLESFLKRIVETKDQASLIAEFKKIILHSFGVKSDDGKRFMKSETLRNEFEQTAAYDALFIDLATNENSAAEFIKGILPKDMQTVIAQIEQVGAAPSNLPAPTGAMAPPSGL